MYSLKSPFFPLWKTRANTSCKTCKTFLRFVSPLTVPSTEEILLSASLNLCILSHHARQEEKQKQGDWQSKNANNGIAEVTFQVSCIIQYTIVISKQSQKWAQANRIMEWVVNMENRSNLLRHLTVYTQCELLLFPR